MKDLKKLFVIYLFYNIFLKIFFSLFNHIIYVEYPETIKQFSFFLSKADDILSRIIGIIGVFLVFDLFFLLPFTVMNLYIFVKLLNHLIKERGDVYQHLSFIILKVYLFWCIIYLCSIGFGSFVKENKVDSLLGGPVSPYGGYSITYLLLGNFLFLLIFVPLWNGFIKNWVMKVKD